MRASLFSILLIAIPSITHCEESSAPTRIDSITKSARELMPTIPALPSVSLPRCPIFPFLTFPTRPVG